jgi:hydrogenase maturation protease
MSLLTVIGMGNRLYCDDGIGNIVVEALAAKNVDSHIEYVVGETDIDSSLSKIHSQYVVIVDAVRMGKNPCSVQAMPLSIHVIPNQSGISMHNQHLLHLLKMNLIVKGKLIGVEPYDVSLRFGLSDFMKQNFDDILSQSNLIIHHFISSLVC